MSELTTKSKKAKPVAAQPADPKQISVTPQRGENVSEAMARVGLGATAQATGTVRLFQNTMHSEHFVAQAVLDNLDRKCAAIQSGDLSSAEQMLFAQAEALQTMFHSLASRALTNINGGSLQVGETYMRMALKAQSQCRTTIEALAEIKYPKSATFIRQANIANQQQVNNGQPDGSANAHPRAQEKNITPTNELLEVSNGERLDTGTSGTAGGINPGMEAVGTVNRAEDGSRKGSGRKKRL